MSKKWLVVGAGLVGTTFSMFLKKQGKEVILVEKRPDMRKQELDGGRSINLIVTSRGLQAFEELGITDAVLALTTPVYGRMIHSIEGNRTYQSYSKDNTDCNHSISRAELNKELMTQAEKMGVLIEFEKEVKGLNLETHVVTFADTTSLSYDYLVGADGGGSAIRSQLVEQNKLQHSLEMLEHQYKELLIPANPDGSYPLSQKALHIWPRGDHMFMALPNQNGSLTATLYLAEKGENSFASLSSETEIQAYFQKYYQETLSLVPNLIEQFMSHPTGFLGTVRTSQWNHKNVVLIGDAAHAIVPFFGQGMNAGLEDCFVLNGLLQKSNEKVSTLFETFSLLQKPNGDAIADMALENFVEMRDSVGDPDFLHRKACEAWIGREFPDYCSRYSMVTHTLIPYQIAQEAGVIQKQILQQIASRHQEIATLSQKEVQALLDEKWMPFLNKHPILQSAKKQ